MAPAAASYYLIGQSRGGCYAERISFKDKAKVSRTIAASLFPTGIARFTLLGQNRQLLMSAFVYINHQDTAAAPVLKPGYKNYKKITH